MSLPDPRGMIFEDGVVAEPDTDRSRFVLWIPVRGEENGAFWDRLNYVPRTPLSEKDGLQIAKAASIRTRVRQGSLLRTTLTRLLGKDRKEDWVLPTGQPVERVGERRDDLALVWPTDPSTPATIDQVRDLWPGSSEIRRLASHLYLVSGVTVSCPSELPSPPPAASRQDQAQSLLIAAQQAGDAVREISAMTDLGIILAEEKQPEAAIKILQDALRLCTRVRNSERQADVLVNLGLAWSAMGQCDQAIDLFRQAQTAAVEAGSIHMEKFALEKLGMALEGKRHFQEAMKCFERAATLAREANDLRQEATLLWRLSVYHAELGQRSQAIHRARRAVESYRATGQPEADVYAEHLAKFEQNSDTSANVLDPDPFSGGSISTAGFVQHSAPATAAPGPTPLHMAFSAAQAMGKWIRSKGKLVSPETARARMAICASCEHHTGLRCRVCGCFTAAKARLPHEDCPLRKWPGSRE